MLATNQNVTAGPRDDPTTLNIGTEPRHSVAGGKGKALEERPHGDGDHSGIVKPTASEERRKEGSPGSLPSLEKRLHKLLNEESTIS